MSSSTGIPPAAAEFVQSIHDQDSSKLASTFASSGVLIDESKTYKTPEAIEKWSHEALVSHQATVKVVNVHVEGNKTVLRVMMDGDFEADYGIKDPFPLFFHFDLNPSGDKIMHLRIDNLAPDEPTMRAVWASRGVQGDPFEGIRTGLRRVPKIPEGWVKVRVSAVGLNYHDIFTLQGLGFWPITFPVILGNECAGTLEDGSEVIVFPLIFNPDFKGKDATLDPKRHVLGELTQGALAEYVVVPKENVIPKPKTLSKIDASVLGVAWLTAYRMLFTHSRLTKGDTMLVQGSAGGVATALIQLGVAAGMTVYTTGRNEEKRGIAKRLGAHETFQPGQTLPRQVDAVFDLSGKDTLDHSFASVRAGGTIVVSGMHSGSPEVSINLFRVVTEQITLVGNYLGTREDFEAMIKFVVDHNIKPEVAAILSLDEAEEGYRKMYDGSILGKVVISL